MTLPASGSLSFSQIQTEFTGSNPISLSEYYRTSGASYVQNIPANINIPTSGTISVSNFYSGQGRLVATLTTIGNSAYFNLADALASVIGWDRVTPIDVTLNISGAHKIYSANQNQYALVIPNFPNGSIVTINNSGFIAGAGGFPAWLGPYDYGGPALYVGFSNTVINNYNWIVGGGGAGGHPGQDTRQNEGGVDPVRPAGVGPGGNGGAAMVIQPPDLRIDWPRIYNYGVIAGGGGGGGGGQYQGVISSCAPPGGGEAGYEVRAPGGGGGAGQSYETAYGGYFAFGRSACPTDGGDQSGFGGLGGNSSLLGAPGAGGNGTTRNGSGGAVAVGGAGGTGGTFGAAGAAGGSGGGAGGAGGYSKLTLSGTSTTVVQGNTPGPWA